MKRKMGLAAIGVISAAFLVMVMPWAHAGKEKLEVIKGESAEILDLEKDPGYYFLLAEQAEARGDMQAVF